MFYCFVEWIASRFSKLSLLVIMGVLISPVSEADIEPRSYSNIPVGLNFLLAGYTYMKGNVAFAPTLPINNAKLETSSAFLAYVRSLDVWGNPAKLILSFRRLGYPVKQRCWGNKGTGMLLVLPIPWFDYMSIFLELRHCR